jgi:hypothetical protein
MYIYYTLFLFIFIQSLLSLNKTILESKYVLSLKILFIITTTILIIIVGFRKIGVSVDDESYLYMYQAARKGVIRKDYLFYVFSNIFPNIHLLFFTSCLISISINSSFILKHTNYFGIVFLLYFSSLFFLHDFVQIRVGIASSLLLWILYYAGKGKKTLSLLINFVAISAHLSAIIFIPLIFLKKINKKFVFIIVTIISVVIAFFYPLDLNSLSQILPGFIYNRIKIFLLAEDYEANIFNPIAIIHYIFAIIIFTNWKKLANFSSNSIFVMVTFLISLDIFLIFHNIGIGFRLYELLVIVQLPLIDIFLRALKRKHLILGLVILLSFAYIYYYLIKYPVVNSYSLFF